MRHDTQAWAPAGRLNKVGFSPIEGLLVRVFSYWCGPITWMERLSIGSARAAGHRSPYFLMTPMSFAAERWSARSSMPMTCSPTRPCINFAACTHLTTPITYGSSVCGARLALGSTLTSCFCGSCRPIGPDGLGERDSFAMLFSDCPKTARSSTSTSRSAPSDRCLSMFLGTRYGKGSSGKSSEWVTQCRARWLRPCSGR